MRLFIDLLHLYIVISILKNILNQAKIQAIHFLNFSFLVDRMIKLREFHDKLKEYVIILFSCELFIGIYLTCLSSGLLKKYQNQRSLNIERYNLYARRWNALKRDSFKPFHFRYFLMKKEMVLFLYGISIKVVKMNHTKIINIHSIQ